MNVPTCRGHSLGPTLPAGHHHASFLFLPRLAARACPMSDAWVKNMSVFGCRVKAPWARESPCSVTVFVEVRGEEKVVPTPARLASGRGQTGAHLQLGAWLKGAA